MYEGDVRTDFRSELNIGDRWSLVFVGVLGVYLVLVPSISVIPSLEPYNEKRVLQIGLLLFGGGFLLGSHLDRTHLLSSFWGLPLSARWGLGAVLGLGVFSASVAPALFYAFLEVSHFVLLFVAAGIVASAVRQIPQQTEQALFGAVVVSALLYAVYFAVRYATSSLFPGVSIGQEILTGFVNTRFFNQYQTWTLPLLGGAVLALPRVRWAVRGCVFGLAALWWALVFASNVTGTILALGIASVGIGLLFRRRAYGWLGVQGGAVLAGGLLYILLFYLAGNAAPEFGERIRHASTESWRVERWITSLELAWAHPFLGAGPMHFAWPPFHFMTGAHPHNAFFQWLGEWGIPSTVIMSGLTIWGGWRWMQQEKNDAKTTGTRASAISVALVASVLAGAAHAMVSGIIVMPVSQVLLVLVGGWAWGRYRPQHQSTNSEISTRSHALLCVLLIGAMGIVGSSLTDLSTVQKRQSAFVDATERTVFSPRYWCQGYIGVRDSSVIERARYDR